MGGQAGAFYEDRVAKGNICHVRHERPWFVQSYRAAAQAQSIVDGFNYVVEQKGLKKVHFIAGFMRRMR